MDLRTAEKKRNWATVSMVTFTVLLAIAALVKVADLRAREGDVPSVIAPTGGDEDPNAVQDRLAEARKTADQLKEKNLFVKKPPRQNPVKQIDGILGREVLVGGKWYKAGAKVGDAKILEIGATHVKVEWDGKELHVTPIATAGSGPPTPPRPRPPKKEDQRPAPPKPSPDVAVVKAEPAPPVPEDEFAWLGIELSSRVREKLAEFWNKMSDEEKEKAKQEWGNMSEDQKEEAVRQIESQL